MNSLLRKYFCCFCVLLTMALINCGYSNSSNSKDSDIRSNEIKESEIPKELQGLELYIALVVSNIESSTRLVFIAKNNSDHDISIPEFLKAYNSIEITRPDGKRVLIRALTKFEQIVIKPSEKKKWFMNTTDLSELLMIENAEGLYRIKWKIDFVESQEFLLLKEKAKSENQQTKTP